MIYPRIWVQNPKHGMCEVYVEEGAPNSDCVEYALVSKSPSRLRELVDAWRAQQVKCSDAFDASLKAINMELDAVGGFATTSPEWKEGKGYCRDFWRQDDTYGGGVTVAGEECGPEHKFVAPVHAEVGDRCFALEQVARKEALALTEALFAVRGFIAGTMDQRIIGAGDIEMLSRRGLGPEHVALALLRDMEPR